MKENQKRKKVSYEMYQKAMDEKSIKDQNQLKYVVIFMLLFFFTSYYCCGNGNI